MLWQARRGLICGRGALDGTASSWQTTFSQTLTSDNPGWNGYNVRQVVNAGLLSVSGTKVRLTIEASAAAGGFTVDHAEIGHQAGAGDAYDFDGSQVALTFSTGSASVVVATGGTVVSDEITYAFDKTKNFVMAFHFNAASDLRAKASLANAAAYYKLAANEVATSDVSAYATAGDALVLVNKIEVFV